MTFFDFTTGIPAALNNPSDDQPDMLINTNSENGIWNIDHYGFNDELGGWHDIIHMPAQTSDPSPVTTPANAGQAYVKSVGSPSLLQLFYRDQLGNISQLTGNLTIGGGSGPPPTWNAKTLLANKLTIICGNSVISTSATPITFPSSGFFATCFAVIISVADTSAATTDTVVQQAYPTKTGFTARVNAGGSRNCSWVAIGI
jgi:hypothetical protein